MKISKEIISKEVQKTKEHYDKLEALFKAEDIPKPEQISGTIKNLKTNEIIEGLQLKEIMKSLKSKETFDSLKLNDKIQCLEQVKFHKKYTDIISRYPMLEKYCGKTIYIFSVKKFPYSKLEVDKRFEEIKNSKEGKKVSLCRINNSTEWKNVQSKENICLYVGSSDDIRQRLREHLFNCNPSSYAMHLETWLKEPTVNITINIWGFYGLLRGKDSDYLQNIEDLLWNHYRPLFGRQGKK